MTNTTNGVTIYEGPSTLTGDPIVVIATGIVNPSQNDKTGKMIQVWILNRDVSPVDAAKHGSDVAVCGDCPQRHYLGGGCYVTLHQAPLSVWRAFHRGRYPRVLPATAGDLFAFREIRLGAYGDPAAVPTYVWEGLMSVRFEGHTGYTHQWRDCDPRLSRWMMASCDNDSELALARMLGWRAFVGVPDEESIPAGAILCPALAGKTNCADCLLCGGNARPARDIAAPTHGARASSFVHDSGAAVAA